MNVVLRCMHPDCKSEYPIKSTTFFCEKGHPLDVVYHGKPDKAMIEVFYRRRDHHGNIYDESGVWRFRELINFCQVDTHDTMSCAKYLVSLDGVEGRQSKPYHMKRAADLVGARPESLWLQSEGYNPSGSFKDNGMATALTHAKMVGATKVVCASTGNTSASAGMFAANEGIDCDVYIPSGQIAPGKLSQAYQFGAQIVKVDGNFDDALEQSLQNTKTGGYTVNSINPFRIEGQKTIPYRVLEYMEWHPPDWIVYPGGALGNTSSCGKALMELHEWGWIKKMPRIAVINAEGASTLSDLYNGRYGEKVRWNDGRVNTEAINEYYSQMDSRGLRPKTQATAIQIGKPANILKGLRALDVTDGVVITVSDKEMLDAMSVIGLNGFDCEMASGASLAGARKLIEQGIMKPDDRIVCILTGRQKDPMLPVEYHNDQTNRFARPPRNN